MPKITIYQKPTCTTCRQVYNALKESGVDFEAVDYQLCRYITRPAIANERLKRNRAGQVVLQLKSPYKDGTTHILWSRWSSWSAWLPWCRGRFSI
jgi:glutaredoxin